MLEEGPSFDEDGEIPPEDIYTVVGEDGNPRQCAILAVVEYDGEDYALLGRLDQLDAAAEELELCILQYVTNADGEQVLEPIEDEGQYLQLQEVFSTLIEESQEEGTEPMGEA